MGPGYGESIIIEAPPLPPAVIDCGTQRLARYVITYLKDVLKAKELSFLAVTHPHKDHMPGLTQVLEAFKSTREFWYFPGFTAGDGLSRWIDWAKRNGVADRLDDTFYCASVARAWSYLSRSASGYGMDPKEMRQRPNLFQSGFRIRCLLPVAGLADRFSLKLANCPQEDAASGSVSFSPPKANEACPVLLLRWKHNNILLCADAELPAWEAFIGARGRLPQPITYIKIGHHGSVNGLPEFVLDRLSKDTHATIAPKRDGRTSLPSVDVLERLRGRCGTVGVTANGSTAAVSTVSDRDREGTTIMLAKAINEEDERAHQLLRLVNAPTLENRISLYFNGQGQLIEPPHP
jgi:hypothetical protein